MHKSEADIRRILQIHGDALYRTAFLLLGNQADVQDTLQEVLLRFFEKAPAFSTAEHERAWLLHVTTNCCMDCLRFRKKHTCVDLSLLQECLAAPEPAVPHGRTLCAPRQVEKCPHPALFRGIFRRRNRADHEAFGKRREKTFTARQRSAETGNYGNRSTVFTKPVTQSALPCHITNHLI